MTETLEPKFGKDGSFDVYANDAFLTQKITETYPNLYPALQEQIGKNIQLEDWGHGDTARYSIKNLKEITAKTLFPDAKLVSSNPEIIHNTPPGGMYVSKDGKTIIHEDNSTEPFIPEEIYASAKPVEFLRYADHKLKYVLEGRELTYGVQTDLEKVKEAGNMVKAQIEAKEALKPDSPSTSTTEPNGPGYAVEEHRQQEQAASSKVR